MKTTAVTVLRIDSTSAGTARAAWNVPREKLVPRNRVSSQLVPSMGNHKKTSRRRTKGANKSVGNEYSHTSHNYYNEHSSRSSPAVLVND